MVEPALICLFVLLLSIIIYRAAFKNHSYWKDRNVVGPKPLPFLGNYLDMVMMRKNVGQIAETIYRQFPKEEYVGVLLGTEPTLVIRNPDLVKLIMTKDFYYFYSRGFDFDIKQEPMLAHLFATSGDIWRLLRHNLTPLFSSAKMRNMFYLVTECGTEFEEYSRKRLAASDGVDEARDLMSRFSIDVIGSCAFGLKVNSMKEEDNTFRNMGYKILGTSILRIIRVSIRFIFPFIFNKLKLQLIDKDVQNFFVELSQKSIAMREGKPAERHDFIDQLTVLKQRGYIEGDGIENMKPGAERKTISVELNDKLLAAQSLVFFVAGYETSSSTMSFVLYELAKHPQYQKRVVDEIDALLQKHGGKITYEMLKEAEYLNMVMNEAMRKYPVLQTITRQCTSRYVLPDGKVVEKGVRIHIPVSALHYDPDYYPDPEKFDPERFTPERQQARNPYTFMPFGEGHRICIGMRFGLMQVVVGLVSVLRLYSVSPTDKTPERLEFSSKSMVTTPTTGIWLKFTARSK